jgi:hypothetical protein
MFSQQVGFLVLAFFFSQGQAILDNAINNRSVIAAASSFDIFRREVIVSPQKHHGSS